MWPNPQFSADLVTFTEKFLIENFIFCAVTCLTWSWLCLCISRDKVQTPAIFWLAWTLRLSTNNKRKCICRLCFNYPGNIYMFKVNNKKHQNDCIDDIVNFEHISHLFLVFLLLNLNKEVLVGYLVGTTSWTF